MAVALYVVGMVGGVALVRYLAGAALGMALHAVGLR
jgi:hypothetical protein